MIHPEAIKLCPLHTSSIRPSKVNPSLLPGIGAACAIALAQAGASICMVQRHPADQTPPNLETLNSIRLLGATVELVYCNLDDLNDVRQVFQKALDVMGGQIHILVNCAGIQRRSPSVDFPESDWDDVRIALFSLLQESILTQYPRTIPLKPRLENMTSFRLPFFAGPWREPQGSLASCASRRSTHGPLASRKDYQLLFSPYVSRRGHRSGICGSKGCTGSTNKSSQQRMEST